MKEKTNQGKLFQDLEDIRRQAEKESEAVDWEMNRRVIMQRIQAEREPIRDKIGIFAFPRRTALAGIAMIAACLIASLVIFLPGAGETLMTTGRVQNLEVIQNSFARMDTIDYLRESEMILSEIMDESMPAEFSIEDNRDRIRSLLRKKNYLDKNLGDLNLAKARPVCNQIELLLFELTSQDHPVSRENIELVRDFVKSRKLLLKINILQDELSEREV
jgi:hypothetical protein